MGGTRGRCDPATEVAGSEVSQIAASPDGQLLAVSPRNRSATLWDLRSRSRLGDEFPSRRAWSPAAFEPNGRLLLTEVGSNIERPTDPADAAELRLQTTGRDRTREDWKEVLPTRSYRPGVRGTPRIQSLAEPPVVRVPASFPPASLV